MRKALRLAALVIFVAFYVKSAAWYSFQYQGVVLDESGGPVEGAVVAVGWVVQFDASHPLKFLESKTNRGGEFIIPAWIDFVYFPWYRMVGSPYLYVSKEGYIPLRLQSGVSYSTNATPKFGVPIILKRLDGVDPSKAYVHISLFMSGVCGDMHLSYGNEDYARLGKLNAELDRMLRLLPTLAPENKERDGVCGL